MGTKDDQKHNWTAFETRALVCALASGKYHAHPDKLALPTALNTALHGRTCKDDIDWREVHRYKNELLRSRPAFAKMLERHPVAKMTRTLWRVFERALPYAGEGKGQPEELQVVRRYDDQAARRRSRSKSASAGSVFRRKSSQAYLREDVVVRDPALFPSRISLRGVPFKPIQDFVSDNDPKGVAAKKIIQLQDDVEDADENIIESIEGDDFNEEHDQVQSSPDLFVS